MPPLDWLEEDESMCPPIEEDPESDMLFLVDELELPYPEAELPVEEDMEPGEEVCVMPNDESVPPIPPELFGELLLLPELLMLFPEDEDSEEVCPPTELLFDTVSKEP
jgi:hypothetical protein